jgi:hypothetical protein
MTPANLTGRDCSSTLRTAKCGRQTSHLPTVLFRNNNDTSSKVYRRHEPAFQSRSPEERRWHMFPIKTIRIRSYEMGLRFHDGEFRGLLAEGT